MVERANSASLTEKLKEKKEPSLGEFNPLIFPPDLSNPETLEVLRRVASENIRKMQLIEPLTMETVRAWDPWNQKIYPRIIIRFETDNLSESQLGHLEDITKKVYGKSIVGRTTTNGQSIPASYYPNTEMPKGKKRVSEDTTKLGWYIGTDSSTPAGSHMGLFVHRDLGKADMAAYLKSHSYKEWFFKDRIVNPLGKDIERKYQVEIHEADLYQTDIVEFALQVASVLKTGKPIENPRLKYEVYNDLNRLGLKKTRKEDIQGLDDQLDRLERTLIIPLANLNASNAINLEASSALLIGVPGTGKTYAAEYFLQQDTGVFILPIDSRHIARELSQPPEKMTILPRISEVFKQTEIPVVLHVDDIEKIADSEQVINSTILNLMAGVRESGFYIIASTNYPEKLSSQLLQPQRFSEVIYFGLQPEDVRLKILDTHALKVSKELGRQLFTSDEERNVILRGVARITDSFTPRYLSDICTQAKTYLLQRESRLKRKKIGLTEEDLETTFTIEDWQQAIDSVARKYDKETVKKRDEELRKFAEHHKGDIGFNKINSNGHMPDLKKIIFEMRKI